MAEFESIVKPRYKQSIKGADAEDIEEYIMPIEKKIEEKTNNEIENHVSISPGSSTIVLPDDLYTSNRDGENFQVDEEGRNENDAAVELLQIETGNLVINDLTSRKDELVENNIGDNNDNTLEQIILQPFEEDAGKCSTGMNSKTILVADALNLGRCNRIDAEKDLQHDEAKLGEPVQLESCLDFVDNVDNEKERKPENASEEVVYDSSDLLSETSIQVVFGLIDCKDAQNNISGNNVSDYIPSNMFDGNVEEFELRNDDLGLEKREPSESSLVDLEDDANNNPVNIQVQRKADILELRNTLEENYQKQVLEIIAELQNHYQNDLDEKISKVEEEWELEFAKQKQSFNEQVSAVQREQWAQCHDAIERVALDAEDQLKNMKNSYERETAEYRSRIKELLEREALWEIKEKELTNQKLLEENDSFSKIRKLENDVSLEREKGVAQLQEEQGKIRDLKQQHEQELDSFRSELDKKYSDSFDEMKKELKTTYQDEMNRKVSQVEHHLREQYEQDLEKTKEEVLQSNSTLKEKYEKQIADVLIQLEALHERNQQHELKEARLKKSFETEKKKVRELMKELDERKKLIAEFEIHEQGLHNDHINKTNECEELSMKLNSVTTEKKCLDQQLDASLVELKSLPVNTQQVENIDICDEGVKENDKLTVRVHDVIFEEQSLQHLQQFSESLSALKTLQEKSEDAENVNVALERINEYEELKMQMHNLIIDKESLERQFPEIKTLQVRIKEGKNKTDQLKSTSDQKNSETARSFEEEVNALVIESDRNRTCEEKAVSFKKDVSNLKVEICKLNEEIRLHIDTLSELEKIGQCQELEIKNLILNLPLSKPSPDDQKFEFSLNSSNRMQELENELFECKKVIGLEKEADAKFEMTLCCREKDKNLENNETAALKSQLQCQIQSLENDFPIKLTSTTGFENVSLEQEKLYKNRIAQKDEENSQLIAANEKSLQQLQNLREKLDQRTEECDELKVRISEQKENYGKEIQSMQSEIKKLIEENGKLKEQLEILDDLSKVSEDFRTKLLQSNNYPKAKSLDFSDLLSKLEWTEDILKEKSTKYSEELENLCKVIEQNENNISEFRSSVKFLESSKDGIEASQSNLDEEFSEEERNLLAEIDELTAALQDEKSNTFPTSLVQPEKYHTETTRANLSKEPSDIEYYDRRDVDVFPNEQAKDMSTDVKSNDDLNLDIFVAAELNLRDTHGYGRFGMPAVQTNGTNGTSDGIIDDQKDEILDMNPIEGEQIEMQVATRKSGQYEKIHYFPSNERQAESDEVCFKIRKETQELKALEFDESEYDNAPEEICLFYDEKYKKIGGEDSLGFSQCNRDIDLLPAKNEKERLRAEIETSTNFVDFFHDECDLSKRCSDITPDLVESLRNERKGLMTRHDLYDAGHLELLPDVIKYEDNINLLQRGSGALKDGKKLLGKCLMEKQDKLSPREKQTTFRDDWKSRANHPKYDEELPSCLLVNEGLFVEKSNVGKPMRFVAEADWCLKTPAQFFKVSDHHGGVEDEVVGNRSLEKCDNYQRNTKGFSRHEFGNRRNKVEISESHVQNAILSEHKNTKNTHSLPKDSSKTSSADGHTPQRFMDPKFKSSCTLAYGKEAIKLNPMNGKRSGKQTSKSSNNLITFPKYKNKADDSRKDLQRDTPLYNKGILRRQRCYQSISRNVCSILKRDSGKSLSNAHIYSTGKIQTSTRADLISARRLVPNLSGFSPIVSSLDHHYEAEKIKRQFPASELNSTSTTKYNKASGSLVDGYPNYFPSRSYSSDGRSLMSTAEFTFSRELYGEKPLLINFEDFVFRHRVKCSADIASLRNPSPGELWFT